MFQFNVAHCFFVWLNQQAVPMTSYHRTQIAGLQTADGRTFVHWKGAAEIMLEFCSQTLEADGTCSPLTPEKV